MIFIPFIHFIHSFIPFHSFIPSIHSFHSFIHYLLCLQDCSLVLSSDSDNRGCYPLDDHILCKLCNARRIQVLTGKVTTDLWCRYLIKPTNNPKIPTSCLTGWKLAFGRNSVLMPNGQSYQLLVWLYHGKNVIRFCLVLQLQFLCLFCWLSCVASIIHICVDGWIC